MSKLNFGWVDTDGKIIFTEKIVRTIPYGFLGVLFGIYMAKLGFQPFLVGAVLTITVFTSALYTVGVSFLGLAAKEH